MVIRKSSQILFDNKLRFANWWNESFLAFKSGFLQNSPLSFVQASEIELFEHNGSSSISWSFLSFSSFSASLYSPFSMGLLPGILKQMARTAPAPIRHSKIGPVKWTSISVEGVSATKIIFDIYANNIFDNKICKNIN